MLKPQMEVAKRKLSEIGEARGGVGYLGSDRIPTLDLQASSEQPPLVMSAVCPVPSGLLPRLSLMLLLAALCGCNQNLRQEYQALREQSENARTAQTLLEQRVSGLEEKIEGLQARLAVSENRAAPYSEAEFDPAGGGGFQRLDSPVGSFAISIEDVRPYADGVMVLLNVGNLTSATVSSSTFTSKWGTRPPDPAAEGGFAKYIDWLGSLTTQEVPITKKLKSGVWNKVTLRLPGIPPDSFGYLSLTLSTEQIALQPE